MEEDEFWKRFNERIGDRERLAILEANYATMKEEVHALQRSVSWIMGCAIITTLSATGTMFTLFVGKLH